MSRRRADLYTPFGDATSITGWLPCKFCDGEWAVVELPDGRHALAHTEPYCAQFEKDDNGETFLGAQQRRLVN